MSDARVRRALTVLALAAIFVLAFWLRRDAFWLPHWKGDQNHYVVLAMKLDKMGLDHYNLREVELGNRVISHDPEVGLVYLRPGKPGSEGAILSTLRAVGQSYYDEPLHYRAPLFPWLLMMSHRLLAGGEPFYAVCYTHLAERVKDVKPEAVLKAQFWAAVVPMSFNFGVIFLTFLLGRAAFGRREGLWAALLMALNPVGLTLAYRLLTEDATAFFLTLSALSYLVFLRRGPKAGTAAAGVFAGLSILAKQTAGLFLPVAGVYTVLRRLRREKKWTAFFAPEVFLFAAAAVLVSFFWFFKVWQTYGSPVHQPSSAAAAMGEDRTGWFRALALRPPPLVFFSWGVAELVPFFALSLFTLGDFFRQTASAFSKKVSDGEDSETFLWLWVLAFFVFAAEPWNFMTASAGQEHRFFYLAYPPLAVLSSAAAGRLADRLGGPRRRFWAYAAVTFLILLSAAHGLPRAFDVIRRNDMLL